MSDLSVFLGMVVIIIISGLLIWWLYGRSEYYKKYCQHMQDLYSSACADLIRASKMRAVLDQRIHNQRKSLRTNWEIFEKRQRYMGSPASRKYFERLLDRNKQLHDENKELKQQYEHLLTKRT